MIQKIKPENKEYQTLRLFATLGILTIIAVLLLRVVLFGPRLEELARTPAEMAFPVVNEAFDSSAIKNE